MFIGLAITKDQNFIADAIYGARALRSGDGSVFLDRTKGVSAQDGAFPVVLFMDMNDVILIELLTQSQRALGLNKSTLSLLAIFRDWTGRNARSGSRLLTYG